MSTISKGLDVCRLPPKKKKRKKCKHNWCFSHEEQDGTMVTITYICSKCGKADEGVRFIKPKGKKPIRKKVVRTVYRWFCPECGKQMSVEDYSGGHGGGGVHLKCSNKKCKHHTEWLDHP